MARKCTQWNIKVLHLFFHFPYYKSIYDATYILSLQVRLQFTTSLARALYLTIMRAVLLGRKSKSDKISLFWEIESRQNVDKTEKIAFFFIQPKKFEDVTKICVYWQKKLSISLSYLTNQNNFFLFAVLEIIILGETYFQSYSTNLRGVEFAW